MTSRIPAAQYRKASNDEHQIQVAIITYLDAALPKSVRAVGVSNNPRSAVQGAREKARGMRKGFTDILLTGSFHGLLEVKKEGGRLSPEQKEWKAFCEATAVPYAVVRSVDDVKEVLHDWGIIA